MQASLVTRWTRCGSLATVVFLSAASAAHAQTVSPLELERLLKAGDSVTVTDRKGAVTSGTLAHLSDLTLEIAAESGALVEVSSSAAMRIERERRRTGRGALVGLAVGAAAGALLVAASPPCSGPCFGPSRSAVLLPAAGVFGGIGAGVGALVGRAWPARTTIHVSRRPTPAP